MIPEEHKEAFEAWCKDLLEKFSKISPDDIIRWQLWNEYRRIHGISDTKLDKTP